MTLQADPDRLRQIMHHLCDNAIKFTAQGTISITYKPLGHNQVEIRVKDMGIGIAKKDLPFIFDRFRQIDNSSTRAYDGAGLGLAVTRELVRLHQGSIRVESQFRKGSTFIVALPLVPQ